MMNTTELKRVIKNCREFGSESQRESAYISILERYFNGDVESVNRDIEDILNNQYDD